MTYNNNYNNSFGVRILSKYFNVTLILVTLQRSWDGQTLTLHRLDFEMFQGT